MTLNEPVASAVSSGIIAKVMPKEIVTISVVHSGNVKKYTYSDYITSILGGSKKTSLASLATEGDWYQDRSSGILYYYTASSSKTVVITFSLFIKTGNSEPLNVSLLDATSDLVTYEGRLSESSFSQNIEDISNGTLAVSATSISIINTDSFYNYLARDSVSFKASDIEVYLYINEISNGTVVFKGVVESAKFADSMTLEVKDSIKKLQSPPNFSSYEGDYRLTSSGQFGDPTPNAVSEENYGKPIPLILGEDVSYRIKKTPIPVFTKDYTNSDGDITTLVDRVVDSYEIDEEDALPAYDLGILWGIIGYVDELNFNGTIKETYSCDAKYFSCCRTINSVKTSYPAITITSLSMVEDLDSHYYQSSPIEYYTGKLKIKLAGTGRDAAEFFDGQLCSMMTTGKSDGGLSGTNYPTISTVSNSYGASIGLHKVVYRDIVENSIIIDNFFSPAPWGTPKAVANETKIFFTPIIAGYFEDNAFVAYNPISTSFSEIASTGNSFKKVRFYMAKWNAQRLGYDYDPSLLLTMGRTYKRLLGTIREPYKELAGFTENYPPNATTFPTEYNYDNAPFQTKDRFVKFKQQNTGLSLGNILHKTLVSAGLETDSGSTLATITSGSFYELDNRLGTGYFALKSTDSDTYLGLLEKMLSSCFAFLYITLEGKIGVRLFESVPYGSTLYQLSEDQIVKGSITSEFTDTNVYTVLNTQSDVSNRLPTYQVTDSDKILLNGSISLTKDNFIATESIVKNKVMPRKYAYYSSSIKRFNFTLINSGFNILLGDRIEVSFSQSKKWLGEDKLFSLFVVGVTKGLDGVEITAIENIFPTL
jgi:hypothetical protein